MCEVDLLVFYLPLHTARDTWYRESPMDDLNNFILTMSFRILTSDWQHLKKGIITGHIVSVSLFALVMNMFGNIVIYISGDQSLHSTTSIFSYARQVCKQSRVCIVFILEWAWACQRKWEPAMHNVLYRVCWVHATSSQVCATKCLYAKPDNFVLDIVSCRIADTPLKHEFYT